MSFQNYNYDYLTNSLSNLSDGFKENENFFCLGVEPSKNISKLAKGKKLNIINDYFNIETANKILNKYNKFDIINLINKDLNNNDYLMIKGSHSTGLHKITNNLKQRYSNVI